MAHQNYNRWNFASYKPAALSFIRSFIVLVGLYDGFLSDIPSLSLSLSSPSIWRNGPNCVVRLPENVLVWHPTNDVSWIWSKPVVPVPISEFTSLPRNDWGRTNVPSINGRISKIFFPSNVPGPWHIKELIFQIKKKERWIETQSYESRREYASCRGIHILSFDFKRVYSLSQYIIKKEARNIGSDP